MIKCVFLLTIKSQIVIITFKNYNIVKLYKLHVSVTQ